MLLAAFLSATAAEPAPAPISAVAMGNMLEVEMPAVQIRAAPPGFTPWRNLADGMAAEIAMEAHGVRVEDASIVKVDLDDGKARLSWTELGSGEMKLRTERPMAGNVCTATVRGGIWSGSGAVVAYSPTAGREEAVGANLGFLLVEDHPRVGALVALAPGDAVTVVNVRRRGELLREWVAVSRKTGTVTVDRRPSGERICFTAPD